jgi:uncharacterized protein (DUF1330 family)
MAKGYWIAHVNVRDPEGYKQYIAANAAPLKKFGARFLVRSGKSELVYGKPGLRHVVIEFDSYEKAVACYHSPEYQAAGKIRDEYSTSEMFVIIEGYEPPQS